jgi:class 3 adenylate cyclase
MPLKQIEGEEPRYDAATLKKVATLAERLQQESRESLTAGEIERIGCEVGLQPAFVRAALAQVVVGETTGSSAAASETAPYVAIGIGTALYSLVTYSISAAQQSSETALIMLWLVLPLFLPAFVGGITRRAKLGLAFGVALILMLLLTGCLLTLRFGGPGNENFWLMAWLYALIGGSLAGGSGWLSGWCRQRPERRPRRRVVRPGKPDRQELLGTLFELQRQLEGPRVHRTFLSVDVAGAAEMKRGESELTVEYSFGEFQHWVREVVTAQGGEILPSVTEGVLCVFPDGAAAARAARQVQETLARFNASGHRLSRPFRVRCGISGGELSAGSLQPAGRPQSWLVDHAISLQRAAEPGDILVSESAAGTALGVLGSLARAAQPVEGEPAFTWRGQAVPNGG